MPFALEIREPGDVGHVGRGQAADGGDEPRRAESLACVVRVQRSEEKKWA
jgi:hypothetical protein